jgi:hypothetical protein
LGIATIGAVRVGLDEFADGETIGGFFGWDGYVSGHWADLLVQFGAQCGMFE